MFTQPVLYPKLYPLLVLGGTLDVLLTSVVLMLGGQELNGVANHVLQSSGLPGLVALKFAMISSVILMCEIVGRRRLELGSRVATFGVGVHAIVVAFTLGQLATFSAMSADSF
jgi:hypothetical protein